MRKIVRAITVGAVLAGTALVASACGDDEDDTPPPPPTSTPPQTARPPQPAAPPGQVMVTVIANSNPPGAAVTGGGRQLGVTPLQTQVPIPAPQPGQVQTFAFEFRLANYQPATINASPVNNTISITAALAPLVQPQEVATNTSDNGSGGDGDEGDELRVRGHGGGPIWDHHTTTGYAVVNQDCTIDRLRVRLNGRHTYHGDLHITLRDPGGRSYSIARGSSANPFRSHSVRRAAGRSARGRWTLSVADRLAQDSGVLRSWNMSIRCR